MTVYHDRLNTFIYLLLRDHVTFGVLEKILQDMGDKADFDLTDNPLMARYVSRFRMQMNLTPGNGGMSSRAD